MKYYNAIDIARVIAAVLVITVHTDPLMTYSETGNYFLVAVIARLAVPFFFVVSGFFYGKKIVIGKSYTHDVHLLFPFLKKLLTIYTVWMFMYLPFQLIAWVKSGESWTYWLSFLQRTIFEGSYYTLWYLTGLMFATAFSYMLFKIMRPQFVLLLTFSLFVIGTMFNSYYDIWQNGETFITYYTIFLTTRNGLFFGAFFVSLGIFLSKRKTVLSMRWNFRLFLISILLLTVEVMNARHLDFSKGIGMWFMLVPTIYFLFRWLQHIEIRDQPYIAYLRPFSLLIYVSHGLFIIVCSRLFYVNSLFYFVIVLFGTCLLSAGILYISKRWKRLEVLY